jgi:hypothetical protein
MHISRSGLSCHRVLHDSSSLNLPHLNRTVVEDEHEPCKYNTRVSGNLV